MMLLKFVRKKKVKIKDNKDNQLNTLGKIILEFLSRGRRKISYEVLKKEEKKNR
jgi:hypothetical protein